MNINSNNPHDHYSTPDEGEFAKVQSLIQLLTGEVIPPEARYTLAFAKLHKAMGLMEALFEIDLGEHNDRIRKAMSEFLMLGSHAMMAEMVVVIEARKKGIDPFSGQDPFSQDFSNN
tara:strand:- start:104 stop:454 length:351 start_codon:yes stop_codon:yes gene_type:complete